MKFTAVSLVIVLAFSLTTLAMPAPTSKFDEFGDINCEDEMARLDNFAVNLQNEPNATGLIIFYGGRRFRGRLPKRGEAAARAARLKSYLVQRRGLSTDRVTVLDGGYTEEWRAEIWIVPAGATMPTPNPTIPANRIKFGKGKATARAFRCEI